VGGDLVSTGSATFGSRLPATWTPTTPSLLVAGRVVNGNPLNLQRGTLWVGNSNSVQQQGNQGRVNGRLINLNGAGAGVRVEETLPAQATTLAATLRAASSALGQAVAENPVTVPGGQPGPLLFTATSSVL
jgi:choice-of-anchor A domain-containing protein